MNKRRIEELKSFEQAIGHQYQDLKLLDTAFTHSSYTNENRTRPEHNERLEFLGDSVVNLIATDVLYRMNPGLPEGELTKLRAAMVCESAFAKLSLSFGIDQYMLLGKGEELSGGRKRESLLSDAFEAFCGSLFLDAGLGVVRKLMMPRFQEIARQNLHRTDFLSDYKTTLQEKYYALHQGRVHYRMDGQEGPDHEKVFFMSAMDGDKVLGKGKGNSKKVAEHKAAKDALERLGILHEG